jgi:predicted ATPase
LLDYLRDKQMLLLLDNYEHLLEGADIAVDILGTASKVKVLVTSRARLSVQGEHLFRLAGMVFPDWETPEDALQSSAVKLFLQSARRVRSGFELEPDDLQYISRICRLVGGMPLGILLAAAWIEMLTPAEIAEEIERGLDFLEDGSRDMPQRQRSVRAVYNHSWNLLAERERPVFAGLSVFRGGFTRDAAQQVAGASLRELRSLVDRSLLHRAPTGRYEMHELLRQYAAEKLDAAPDEGTAVRDGHSAYYVAALQGWEADLKCARQPAVLAEMDIEIDNAHAAWSWAAERGHIDPLDRAMEGMFLFYNRRSRYQEGEAAFRRAAERLTKIRVLGTVDHPADGLRVLAKALLFQAMCAWQQKRTEVAQPLLRGGLDLLERPELAGHDTRMERALLLWGIGSVGWDTGREAIRERFEESLDLFRALDNPWWIASVLNILGISAWRWGEYDRATQWLEEALTLSRTMSDQLGLAGTSLWLSLVHSTQGKVKRAKQLAREGLAIYQELDDQFGIANGPHVLAWPFIVAGEYAESAPLMERSVALFDDIGVPRPVAATDLGRARMHLGEYRLVRMHVEKAIATAQERDMRGETARPLFVLGCVALVEGACEEARQRLAESIAVCQEFENRLWLSKAHAAAGYVARAVGDSDQAQQHLRDALDTTTDRDSFWSVAFTLPLVALLLVDEGELARAVELYALASRYPYVSNSCWFEDVAGRQIAAAALTLPPDAVAVAQERGRARDLWATVEELLAELGIRNSTMRSQRSDC